MSDLVRRVLWLAAGWSAHPVVAFDWIRGRVGSRENPDGMRSLIHAGIALAAACAALDLLFLWRHGWAFWAVLAFSHSAWVSAFIVASALNVGFLETVDGARMRSLGGPNVLTLARGFLIPTLLYVLLMGDFSVGVFFYAIVTATDVADGWWARHGGGQSKLGIVMDPIVDLLLHLAVFVSLSLVGLLGRAALVLILIRSVLLVFGTGLLYFWKGQVRIQPTPFGKGTGFLLTIMTILLLGAASLSAGGSGAHGRSLGVEGAAGLLGLSGGVITILLAISVVHVLAVGLINLSRPPR